MFVRLKTGELKKIILAAIDKARSERSLADITGIPLIAIYRYKNEMQNISEERLYRLAGFLGIRKNDIENMRLEVLSVNWGRKKGGKACYAKKKKDGTWKDNLEKMKIESSKKTSAWHRKMKNANPEQYHLMQYERFKKIGGYKAVSIRGEKMRNSLEKEIADALFRSGIEYEYEPLVKGKKRYYFPDFRIGRIIVECSMWKGEEKAYRLRDKIEDLQKEGYEAVVVVP